MPILTLFYSCKHCRRKFFGIKAEENATSCERLCKNVLDNALYKKGTKFKDWNGFTWTVVKILGVRYYKQAKTKNKRRQVFYQISKEIVLVTRDLSQETLYDYTTEELVEFRWTLLE